MRPAAARFVAIALGVSGLVPGPGGRVQELSGQDSVGPPASAPTAPLGLPEVESRPLPGGARLRVVESREVPLVSIDLVLPGGSALDPQGREGTVSTAALLLSAGSTTRSAEQIRTALDAVGATVQAVVTPDRTVLTLETPRFALDSALAVFADLVRGPTFPPDRLAALRTRSLSALAALDGASGTVADRIFDARTWGPAHPRGRRQTPSSTRAIEREDLLRFRDSGLVSTGATFVAAGAIGAEEAARLIEKAFEGWWNREAEAAIDLASTGGSSPTTVRGTPSQDGLDVVLIHRPGSVQAELRVGRVLAPGAIEDRTALDLANRVLGGGPASRLFRRLREEKGVTYGVSSTLEETPSGLRFLASTAVRTDAAGEAIDEVLAAIANLGADSLPAREFERVRQGSVGRAAIELETARQVATRLIELEALGLGPEALELERARWSGLTAAQVRSAAARHLDPARMVVVVAGDALQIRPQLQALGPVTLLDGEGREITLAQLEAGTDASDRPSLAPSRLTGFRAEYAVLLQGRPFGTVERTLEPAAEGSWTLRSETAVGAQSIDQSVTFDAESFAFLRARQRLTLQGQTASLEVESRDGRMVGSRTGPLGVDSVDVALPPGAVVGDMAELLLWLADLEVGGRFVVPFADPATGAVQRLTVSVDGTESITVLAGTFDAFRVRVGGTQAQTIWARVEAPHWVLRVTPEGQPLSIELRRLPGEG